MQRLRITHIDVHVDYVSYKICSWFTNVLKNLYVPKPRVCAYLY